MQTVRTANRRQGRLGSQWLRCGTTAEFAAGPAGTGGKFRGTLTLQHLRIALGP